MAIMYLSKYELLTLSTHSRIKPDDLSPLTRLYMDQALGMDTDKLREAAGELFQNKYIEKQGEKLLLAKELEPAFFVLHKPGRVIAFKRLGMAEINEIYFAERNGFAVQYTVRYDGLFEALVYPYTMELVKKWFEDELLKDVVFSAEPPVALDLLLTADETIALFAVINIYRGRIIELQRGLEPEETWIKTEEIRGLKDCFDLKGLISMILTEENMEDYFANNPNLDNSIHSLISKGLLQKSEKGISYSDMAKGLFDPGNVVDGIIIKDYSPKKGFLSSINILKSGYMLFTPHQDGLDYRIRTIGAEIGKGQLLTDILGLDEKVTVEKKTEKTETVTEKPRFCGQCGAVLSAESAFCRNCGNKL